VTGVPDLLNPACLMSIRNLERPIVSLGFASELYKELSAARKFGWRGAQVHLAADLRGRAFLPSRPRFDGFEERVLWWRPMPSVEIAINQCLRWLLDTVLVCGTIRLFGKVSCPFDFRFD